MKLTKFKLTFKKAKIVIIKTCLQFYSSVQYSSLNVSKKLRRYCNCNNWSRDSCLDLHSVTKIIDGLSHSVQILISPIFMSRIFMSRFFLTCIFDIRASRRLAWVTSLPWQRPLALCVCLSVRHVFALWRSKVMT